MNYQQFEKKYKSDREFRLSFAEVKETQWGFEYEFQKPYDAYCDYLVQLIKVDPVKEERARKNRERNAKIRDFYRKHKFTQGESFAYGPLSVSLCYQDLDGLEYLCHYEPLKFRAIANGY